MIWKPLTERIKQVATQPDSALLIELASSAVLLAWLVRWAAE